MGLHWWLPSLLGVTVMRPEGRRGARAKAEPGVPGGEVAKGEQHDLFNLHMETGVRQFFSPSKCNRNCSCVCLSWPFPALLIPHMGRAHPSGSVFWETICNNGLSIKKLETPIPLTGHPTSVMPSPEMLNTASSVILKNESQIERPALVG